MILYPVVMVIFNSAVAGDTQGAKIRPVNPPGAVVGSTWNGNIVILSAIPALISRSQTNSLVECTRGWQAPKFIYEAEKKRNAIIPRPQIWKARLICSRKPVQLPSDGRLISDLYRWLGDNYDDNTSASFVTFIDQVRWGGVRSNDNAAFNFKLLYTRK